MLNFINIFIKMQGLETFEQNLMTLKFMFLTSEVIRFSESRMQQPDPQIS